MPVLLEGATLTKRYRSGRAVLEVLQGVELAISSGEIVAVTGPSGAGKSTLLHLLGGIDRPSDGKVLYRHKDLYGLSERERAWIRNRAFGFVFQFYHLVPELTALENVMLPARLSRRSVWGGPARGWGRRFGLSDLPDPAPARERAADLLTQAGLSSRLNHLPAELSGGEQQRVAVARALMNKPELIFCDEPTGNLDSRTGGQILELMQEVNRKQGTAFMIVTHEEAVSRIANRTISLKDGRLWD